MKYLIPFLLASIPFFAQANDSCHHYTETAIVQHINNLKYECGFEGLRWNPHYLGQKAWCETVRPEISNKENITRQAKLDNCLAGKNDISSWDKIAYSAKNSLISAAIEVAKKDDVQALKIFRQEQVNLAFELDGNFGTVLYAAIGAQSANAVKYLISFDDPNRVPNGGLSALTQLMQNEVINYDLLTFLLEHETMPNYSGEVISNDLTPLYIAIKKKDHQAIRILIKHGANPHLKFDFNDLFTDAVKLGDVAVVKTLIEMGAQVNLKDGMCADTFSLPLDVAINEKNISMEQLLRAHGAKTKAECEQN